MKRLAFIFSLCAIICACSDDPDSISPATVELSISFVDSAGTNILDSLLTNETDYVDARAFCQFDCTCQSDKENMYLSVVNASIYPSGLHAKGKAMHIVYKDGRVRDSHRHYPAGRAEEYDETYHLALSSPALFGDSAVHSIDIHTHVSGWWYKYLGTEVDGQPLVEEVGQRDYQMSPISVTFVGK